MPRTPETDVIRFALNILKQNAETIASQLESLPGCVGVFAIHIREARKRLAEAASHIESFLVETI